MKRKILGSFRIIILAMLIVLLSIDILGIYLGLILSNTILGPGLLLETFERHEAYGQIRQLMFRMVKESLPNGQDSIPYLEKAVSEGWLEQEISMLLKNYYAFARGEKRETPIIYFSKLKKQVVDALDGSQPYRDRTRLVQYWFDPLPDEVRLEDFLPVDLIWGVRRIFSLMIWVPWIMVAAGLFIMLIIYLLYLDWKQLLLWLGSALITGGALLILIGLAAMWAAGHMTILAIAVDRIQAYDISKTTALNFFRALLNGIISPMNIIGTISIVIGGTIIYFAPIDREPYLVLVK
ncbi:MAG: hypothetical protein ACOX77_09875 [Caldicoprobacterales bacterium]